MERSLGHAEEEVQRGADRHVAEHSLLRVGSAVVRFYVRKFGAGDLSVTNKIAFIASIIT